MTVIINGTNTPTAGGVTYGDGAAYATTPAGTAGQVLTSAGASAPTWTTLVSTPTLVRSARTSNTILGTADASTLIAITSGTFTQTFTAAATLGSGWFCYIQNLGTGDITLDPNGSETIDGRTSFIMYPGESRLVQCDGAVFYSVVISPFNRIFTTSGTFTKPPGYSEFSVYAIGGGGGGGGGNSVNGGRGGNGGAGAGSILLPILAASLGSSETVTVGSGGTGGSTGNPGNAGNAGGNSSLGTFVVANGGGGGGGGKTYGNSVSGAQGGGTVLATAGYPSGFQTSNQNIYAEFGGATNSAFVASNNSPQFNAVGSLQGGSAGGPGQNENYAGGDGGISRKFGTTVGGGGTGATPNAGQGQDMTGTYAGGGGGSAGRGGHGGIGCGGGGGGCNNSLITGYSGGNGGAGYVQIWGAA